MLDAIEKDKKLAIPKFVVADDDGRPEDITDPIIDGEVIEDEKPKVTKPLKQDPKPAPNKRLPGRPSKSDLEREVAAELQAMLMMMSMLWSNIDAECGPVLNTQSKAIADSLAGILAKNPRLLERMRDMTGIGDYLKLFAAVLPVVKVVQKHHLAPIIQKRSEDGN